MRTLLPRSYSVFCFLLLFAACHTTTKLKKVDSSMIELNSAAPEENSAAGLLLPYKTKMDSIMNEVLGSSDTSLLKGLPESTLGNFVADAVLKKANEHYHPADGIPADICLLNNGGLRSQLPMGKITLGNVYELMPFENMVVVLTLSGEKTKQLFEMMAENNGAPFAGAKMTVKGKKITSLTIGGKEFDANKTYKVVTSDYLSSGGDKYYFFRAPVKTEELNYLLRNAIVDEIREQTKNGKNIIAKKDGRISYE